MTIDQIQEQIRSGRAVSDVAVAEGVSPRMPRMAPSRIIAIRLTEEQAAALESHCAQTAEDKSEVIRRATMRAIGREDLADVAFPIGRPKSPAAETPPRKKRKKRG